MSGLSREDRARLEGLLQVVRDDVPHDPQGQANADALTRALALIDQQGEDRVKATVNLILEILDDYTPDSGLGTARQYVEHSLGTMGAGYRFEELLSAQIE